MQEFSFSKLLLCLSASLPLPQLYRNFVSIQQREGVNIHKRIHNGLSLNRIPPWHILRYYISHKNCICQLSISTAI